MPETRDIGAALTRVTEDAFLWTDASEEMKLTYVARRLAGSIRIEEWAAMTRREVRDLLRSRIGSQAPGLSAAETEARVDIGEDCLAFAVFVQADRRVHALAARQTAAVAKRLQHIGGHPVRTLGMLHAIEEGIPAGPEARSAALEALGLPWQAAQAVDRNLTGRSFSVVAHKLMKGEGLAATDGGVFMADIQTALFATAGELKSLSAHLGQRRDVRVLTEFPALTEGLIRGLPADSFVALAIARRPGFSRMEAAELATVASHRDRVGGLLLGMGIGMGEELALKGHPLGAGLDLAHGFGSLQRDLAARDRAFRIPELSFVSGGMGVDQFQARLGEHKSGKGLAIAWWILKEGVSEGLGLPI